MAQKQCYFPDGNIADNASPCNASAEVSHCCQENDSCVSNGYCFQQYTERGAWNNRLARGSCTDRSFNDSRCAQFCKDAFPEGNQPLWMPDSGVNISLFCCFADEYDSSTETCASANLGSRKPFEIAPGQVIHDRSLGLTKEISAGETVTRTIYTTASVTPTSSVSKTSNVTAIVVGISVPLGVLLLVAIGALMIMANRLRKSKRSQNEKGEHSEFVPHSSGEETLQTEGQQQAHQHRHEAPLEAQRHEISCAKDPVEIATRPAELH